MRKHKQVQAFTLVEMMIAVVLFLMVLGMLTMLLYSGARLFESGNEAARGPEAALLLMDRLEDDLAQVLQIPGDPRPPMKVEKEHRITFYRPSSTWSNAQVLVGEPASWELVPAKGGQFHPACDGKPFDDIHIADWTLKLLAPKAEHLRGGWYLSVVARFRTSSLFSKDHVLSRLLRLPQPSTNFLNFLAFGAEMLPGTVQMLPRPKNDPGFEHLGPPDTDPTEEAR